MSSVFVYEMSSNPRPVHEKDDGRAHVEFGTDPREVLKKFGYCVVENVFSKELCGKTIDAMWRWLEGLGTGIKKADPLSWDDGRWPVHIRAGMIQHTLGQEEFMWEIREHENVVEVFRQIHGTKKLLSSFDGASINRPIASGFTMESAESWLHTDQNVVSDMSLEQVYGSEKYSIQGVANFADVGDEDGSLFVGESSHLLHTKLFAWNGSEPKNNWYLLHKADVDWLLENKIRFVKVNAPAGSLLLFDSRCFHSGCTSMGKDNDRFRYVIYVSLSPASRATEKDIMLKTKAIQAGGTTSHWSSANIKIFPHPRRSKDKDIKYLTRYKNIPDYHAWSVHRKKLAGLIPYEK
ncbi:MAG: 2OG-FeII oxygenase [Hyperionvirus sp.]|uniref:2OG-FeII oxygenase n=1 Tax=Hyperionvirus sp. TaxID=2487770 RepID=A0A3G5A9D7_9VIRU|nr:MAG: 2OG-FeII oxygenase [Hyperionvirus sp.]